MYVLRTYAYYYSRGTRLVLDLLLNCLQESDLYQPANWTGAAIGLSLRKQLCTIIYVKQSKHIKLCPWPTYHLLVLYLSLVSRDHFADTLFLIASIHDEDLLLSAFKGINLIWRPTSASPPSRIVACSTLTHIEP